MREIRIKIPDRIDDDHFDSIWNRIAVVLIGDMPKCDWNIEEVDE